MEQFRDTDIYDNLILKVSKEVKKQTKVIALTQEYLQAEGFSIDEQLDRLLG